MTSAIPTGNHINLQLGWPSPSLFPSAELNASANAVLTDFDAATAALVYGPSRGLIPLRKGMAQCLGSKYYNDYEAVAEDRVCIAGGASQNLSNILLRFTDPTYTRRIWMVEPTYFLACPIFEDCGFVGRMRGVPEDEEGIDLEFLRAALAESEAEVSKSGKADAPTIKTPDGGYEKIYKHLIYVVPTFSNPSGKTMSLQHRYDLVKLAIEYDALIVSDDVYDFLYWPEEKDAALDNIKLRLPPRLVDINRELDPSSKWGNTVSNGSFSKIVAPGVRLSWSESTPAFSTRLATTGASISGGNPGQGSASFIEKILSSGALEKHIQEKLIPTYAKRYHAMVDAIKQYLGDLGVEIATGKPYYTSQSNGDAKSTETIIAGGFFLLINLPRSYPPAHSLIKIAMEQYDLKFAHGKMFEVKGDEGSKQRCDAGFGHTIRLCWAWHEEEAIIDGIKRIRELLIKHKDTI